MIFLYFCLLVLKSLSQMAFYFSNLILQTASKGHNISVNDYLEQAHYDLVIAAFNSQDLAGLKAPVLYLDDLEVPNNVKLLEDTVSQLESEMYQPLLLN